MPPVILASTASITTYICTALVMLLSVGCASTQMVEKMGKEIFALKTRVHELDTKLKYANTDLQGNTERAHQGLASVGVKLDGIERRLQLLSGKLDLMQKALGEERLTPFVQEGGDALGEMVSLQKEVTRLQESLQNLFEELTVKITENVLKVVLDETDKLEKKMIALEEKLSGSGKKRQGKNALASLAQARRAFEQRRYVKLKKDIPGLIPKMQKASSKEELRFYFAQSLFRLGELSAAAKAFNEYVQTKPKASYMRRSQLSLGDIYRLSGDKETAKIYYSELIETYPDSEEAEKAQKKLAGMDS